MDDPEAQILLRYPEPVQLAIQELRRLVKEMLPEAEERAHLGWGIFNYYLNGELGYVGGQGDEAVLGLTRGVDLDDPAGLLVSSKSARYMRQLRLRPGAPLPESAIRDFLTQARRLNLERGSPEAEWRAKGKHR